MKREFAKMIRDYGSPVTIRFPAGDTAVKAFFQPVMARTWNTLQRNVRELGEAPQGQWLYLGPAEPDLAQAEGVQVDGADYRIRRTAMLMHRGQTLYCWAILTREGGEDPWNN